METYNVYFQDFCCLETEQKVKNKINEILKNSGINYEITEVDRMDDVDGENCFAFTILIKNVKAISHQKAIKTVRNVLKDYFYIPDEESGFFYIYPEDSFI